MGFPWSRSNSVKVVRSASFSPTDTKPRRRSSGFLKFNEKGKAKTSTNGINGIPYEAGEDEPKPRMLSRAATNMMPDHATKRQEVENMIEQFSGVLTASLRPLPTSGDGRYEKAEEAKSGLWKDLKHFNITDVKALREVLQHGANGQLIDDKNYMVERIIQLVADLPPGSRNRITITNDFLDQLWSHSQNPVTSFLGDKYNYRQPDGSYNNTQFPYIGQVGQPHTRSVRPMIQRQGVFPDAELIFDALMVRREYKRNPNGVSSMLSHIGTIIVHDVFKTELRDPEISLSSSYLDLSPLYGSSLEDVQKMRTFKNGMIKPDCFSEKRILGFPPAVGVILVMFNRFHNYIAERLAVINEHNRFSLPVGKETNTDALKKQDEDLFQTARLITSGLYINIILNDYLRTILNLNRTNSTWNLDPRVGNEKPNTDGPPRGLGNQIPVEFGLVYRWHSSISKKEELWIEDRYRELFPGQDIHNLDPETLIQGLEKWENGIEEEPSARAFHDVERNPDGTLPDGDLVQILTETIEDSAGNFGPNNVPLILKTVECLGIEQARKWKCASLNEFRNFLGLKSHKTFEDFNSDPKISDALKRLYDHPDFVELYPGLVAEEARTPMIPGVGLCTSFTVSRAILSDLVSLVRGDRFYTIDYTPANLTNWGFSEVASDTAVNQGCVFHKLFLKAFPSHFKWNTIYAFYPLTDPTESHKIMVDLGRVGDFDYSRPKLIPPRIILKSHSALKFVLSKPDFKVTWGENFDYMMSGHHWMLSGDNDMHQEQRGDMQDALYEPTGWQKQIFSFYEQKTTDLLKSHSYEVAGRQMVDAVRDVINLAHTHFTAHLFSLPLKTEENPRGVYTEQELYMILSVMFTFVFFDTEPMRSFGLHKAGRSVASQLAMLIEANVNAINRTRFMKGVIDTIYDRHSALKDYGIHMIRRLLESGKNAEEITWQMVPTASACVSKQGQLFSQILDFYLEPENAEHLAAIQQLSRSEDSKETLAKLRGYVLEGGRLAGTLGLYRKADRNIDIDDGDVVYNLKRGDIVFVNFITASRDPQAFPDPLEVKVDRPVESYIHYGDGRHRCLGRDIDIIALTAMLKVFGKLENLRRAPGIAGTMKYLPRPSGSKFYLKEDWSSLWPFPTTMKVMFDGKIV